MCCTGHHRKRLVSERDVFKSITVKKENRKPVKDNAKKRGEDAVCYFVSTSADMHKVFQYCYVSYCNSF
jgi:hypothetical protein